MSEYYWRKLKKSVSCLFTKNVLGIKNFCFWSDFDETLWDCSTHEHYNLTKFRQNRIKNKNFLFLKIYYGYVVPAAAATVCVKVGPVWRTLVCVVYVGSGAWTLGTKFWFEYLHNSNSKLYKYVVWFLVIALYFWHLKQRRWFDHDGKTNM